MTIKVMLGLQPRLPLSYKADRIENNVMTITLPYLFQLFVCSLLI
jgi:hypothetical protein